MQVSPFMVARQAQPISPALLQPSRASEPPKRKDDDKPLWLEAAGKVAKGISRLAGVDEQTTGGFGQQPDQRRAAAVLRKVTTAPADTFEKLGGRSLDEVFADMRRTYGEELPDDLDREEQGMLLMQLGLGIMTGGPGLAQALGQAGLQTMGTWHELRDRKRRGAREAQRDRLGMLETEARIAAGREEAEARRTAAAEAARAKATQPIKMGPGDVLLDPATQQPLYTAPRAPGREPQEPADLRMMRAQGVDPRNPEQVRQFYANQRAGQSTGSGTALMQNAQYLARVKGIPESQAADLLMMSADARQNPDAVRQRIFEIALRENRGRADRAAQVTEEALRYLQGGPEALASDEPAAQPSPGAWGTILEMVGIEGQSATAAPAEPEAVGPSVTQPIPPAVGAIEDGYRFKGGDPGKPESWERVE